MTDLHSTTVVIEKRHILLVQREDFQVWALPGGKIEPGESVARAAVREVFEETGLNVKLLRLVGIYARPHWPGVTHSAVFAAIPERGVLRPQEGETIDVRYFLPDALPERLLWWHRQPIHDALAGRGGSAVWSQHLVWPFQDDVTPQQVIQWRDQGELPLPLRQKAWGAWCKLPQLEDQTREVDTT